MIGRLILFLVLNFAGLYLGSLFTTPGVNSDWYNELNQAPWTPPGWLFGVAWTTIMICFSIYLAKLFEKKTLWKSLIPLFVFEWLLNVGWNPVFFYHHATGLSLILISTLLLVVVYFAVGYRRKIKSYYTLLLAPYIIWLMIATSLNGYIYLYN